MNQTRSPPSSHRWPAPAATSRSATPWPTPAKRAWESSGGRGSSGRSWTAARPAPRPASSTSWNASRRHGSSTSAPASLACAPCWPPNAATTSRRTGWARRRARSPGQLLAAAGDRDGAVAQLRAAHQLLATVQAEAFTERLAADLRTAGHPRPRRSSRRPDGLTSRENDVATLAAQGLTTPEIADQLYLSVNTVEYHLRNVFTKLGINSRRELRQRHSQETP